MWFIRFNLHVHFDAIKCLCKRSTCVNLATRHAKKKNQQHRRKNWNVLRTCAWTLNQNVVTVYLFITHSRFVHCIIFCLEWPSAVLFLFVRMLWNGKNEATANKTICMIFTENQFRSFEINFNRLFQIFCYFRRLTSAFMKQNSNEAIDYERNKIENQVKTVSISTDRLNHIAVLFVES